MKLQRHKSDKRTRDTDQAWHELKQDEFGAVIYVGDRESQRSSQAFHVPSVIRSVGSRRTSHVRLALKLPESDEDPSHATA